MHVLIQSIIDGFLFGSIYAIAATTFGLVYDVTKVFHIAFGSIGTLGVYVAVALAGDGAAGIIGSIAVGAVASAAATAAVVILAYRPLARRGAEGAVTFVASLGLSLLIQALVVLAFGPDNRSFAVDAFVHRNEVLGFGVSAFHIVAVLLACAVVASLTVLLNHTRAGYHVRAVASNREQAERIGIRADLVTVAACAGASALSVIAFALLGMNGAVVATGGTQLTLFAVLATIAAPPGNILSIGAIGAGLGLLSGVSGALLPGQWSTTAVFLCAFVFILARSRGARVLKARQVSQ